MTPKEKSEELIRKFNRGMEYYMLTANEKEEAKRIVEIAVLEIIDVCSLLEPYLGFDYWQQVKQEINKL